jgi:hypothetical protein
MSRHACTESLLIQAPAALLEARARWAEEYGASTDRLFQASKRKCRTLPGPELAWRWRTQSLSTLEKSGTLLAAMQHEGQRWVLPDWRNTGGTRRHVGGRAWGRAERCTSLGQSGATKALLSRSARTLRPRMDIRNMLRLAGMGANLERTGG